MFPFDLVEWSLKVLVAAFIWKSYDKIVTWLEGLWTKIRGAVEG
jgi:Flp pilus assembly pilin Flp